MRLFVLFAVLFFSTSLLAQTSFYISEKIPFPDLEVEIGENVSFPDVSILLGKNISFEDFTVGITDHLLDADFIITKNKSKADKTVRAGYDVPFEDLTIKVSEDLTFPDLRIEIREYGSVDYKVYTEKSLLSPNDLIIALLPVINKQMGNKFDKVLKIKEK